MENIQLSKKLILNKKYLFAFPGMGKTPLALSNPGFVDADFGYFRTAMKVDKARESVLFKPYVRMIKMWAQDGYKVLTNQPDIMAFVPKKESVCILPLDSSYSARKMKVSQSQVDGWILGWEETAKKFGVQVVWIPSGLDTFLS